jgi:hypothetical protein
MIRNKQTVSLASITIILAVLLQFVSVGVKAQPSGEMKENMNAFYKFTDSTQSSEKVEPNDNKEVIQFTGVPIYDSIMLQSYTDQYVFNVQHEKRAFKLQFYSSIFIFIMVVVIVCMGLVLSYKQFKLNEEIVKHSMKQNTGTIDKGTDTASSMEVSKDGIKMNTAVIGLMILVISLVFFFLYLRFVYHIEIIK